MSLLSSTAKRHDPSCEQTWISSWPWNMLYDNFERNWNSKSAENMNTWKLTDNNQEKIDRQHIFNQKSENLYLSLRFRWGEMKKSLNKFVLYIKLHMQPFIPCSKHWKINNCTYFIHGYFLQCYFRPCTHAKYFAHA